MRVLQVSHAPDHVEDRSRYEQQTCNQAAQNGLWILKHHVERFRCSFQPIPAVQGLTVWGQKHQQKGANGEAGYAHYCPEAVRTNTSTDEWPNSKLTCRSTGHSEHLSGPDQGCSLRWWKTI